MGNYWSDNKGSGEYIISAWEEKQRTISPRLKLFSVKSRAYPYTAPTKNG